MRPIEFKQVNVFFAKDHPEYKKLPALRIKGEDGHVVTCWKANFWERIQILFTGKVWLNLVSFNKPLMPSYMSAYRRGVFSLPKDWKPWSYLVQNLLTKK